MTNKNDTENKNHGFLFRAWPIYKDSLSLRTKINTILQKYPKEERFALIDQTKRALNSIVLNIAEGSNRSTDKDLRLFINRAHTSLDEVVACADCALNDGYITKETHENIMLESENLAKQLRGFCKHLSK